MAHPWQALSLRTPKLSVSRITGELLAALKLFLFTTAPPVINMQLLGSNFYFSAVLCHSWGQSHRACAACSSVSLGTTPCPSCSMCLYCFQQHKLGILIADSKRGDFTNTQTGEQNLHTYPATTSMQVVASGHGALSHQTFSSQNFPVKFAGQLQWKSFQVTMHLPPF